MAALFQAALPCLFLLVRSLSKISFRAPFRKASAKVGSFSDMAMDEQQFFQVFVQIARDWTGFWGFDGYFMYPCDIFGVHGWGDETMMKPASPPSSSSACVVRGRS